MKSTAKGKMRAYRIMAIMLMIVMMMPLTVMAEEVDSVPEPDMYEWSEVGKHTLGELCTKNKTERAIIDWLYYDYLSGNQVYKGSGECYGYAEMVRKMFGTSYKQKNIKVKATKSNVRKYLKGVKTGTHVRFSQNKNGSGYGHSMIVLKATKDGFYCTEANVGGRKNGKRFCFWGYDGFDYYYLQWVKEPRGKATTVKKTAIKGGAYAEGPTDGPTVTIAWRPVKNAKKYVVYRSTKKSSGFKKIATIKTPSYKDKSASPVGKVYYKVKAVKSSGKKLSMSKAIAVKRPLKSPKFHLSSTEDEEGEAKVTLTWKPVKGATKYNIYDYRNEEQSYLIATVSGTEFSYVGRNYGDIAVTALSNRTDSESIKQVAHD